MRIQTLLALIVLAVGVPIAAILGIHMYMSTTARSLHPDPESVPSVTHVSPSREWTDDVEQGRQIVRAGLTGQNLPGLSVAVGVGDELVWAEGFGWADLDDRVPVANEPFLTFMRKQIFEPLGMDDTRADSATEPIPDRVTSYFPRYAADPRYGLHLMREIDYSCYAGSSAFLSTPSDLVRFGMAINSGKLLQPATVQLFQTSQRLPSGEETGYGLG